MDFLKFAQTIFSEPQVSLGPVSDKPPVVKLAKEKHTATMIFLHGLGDNGDVWADVLSNEMPLPYFKYIVPHAASRPVALNLGCSSPAWFDVLGLSENTNEDDAGIEAASLYVHKLIEEEVALGTPSNRIVLGGFSMGGALAIYAGLTCKLKLGCIIGFSGFMLQKHKIPGEHTTNLQTPIFLGHGTKDLLVPASYGIEVGQIVKVFNPNVEFKQYDIGHTCSLEEKVEANCYINKHIPAQFEPEKEVEIELSLSSEVLAFLRKEPMDDDDPLLFLTYREVFMLMGNFSNNKVAIETVLVNAGGELLKTCINSLIGQQYTQREIKCLPRCLGLSTI